MKKNKFIFVVALFLSGILLGVPAYSEEDTPIAIEADRMISQEQSNSVVFLGNVDARQGDVVIRAQEMTVYYNKKQDKQLSDDKDKVKKIVCRKNVEISQGDWLGVGDRMDYLAGERKVVLTGNAKAWQGRNMVSGKKIIYFLDEKRSVVEQDKNKKGGRVKAVIHPSSDKK